MFRHIALFLFSLCLTLPAVAAPLCHAVAAPVTAPVMAHHAGMDHTAMAHHASLSQDDGPAQGDGQGQPAALKRHDCIGCVASFALPHLAAPAPPPPLAQPTSTLHRLHGIAILPALPPPRR